MESQAGKVNRWGAELQVLKVREQNEGTSSALDERIAIIERRLFDAEQQGKFASLFRCPFPFLSITYFCPLSFDISSSPI